MVAAAQSTGSPPQLQCCSTVLPSIRGVHGQVLAQEKENLENLKVEMGPPSDPPPPLEVTVENSRWAHVIGGEKLVT
jgi:hypothetical protein